MTKDGLPWLRYYGAVPPTLRYPEGSLSAAMLATASRGPDAPALTFLGATTTYHQLAEAIERCAAALAGLGLRGNQVTGNGGASPIPFLPAVDLLWDGRGTRDCWQGNTFGTSAPAPLPACR